MNIVLWKLFLYRVLTNLLWLINKHGVFCLTKAVMRHEYPDVLTEYSFIAYILSAIEIGLYTELGYKWLEFCVGILPLLNPFHKHDALDLNSDRKI